MAFLLFNIQIVMIKKLEADYIQITWKQTDRSLLI